jgi:pyruvate/2-oxoglutarate/acetoin dehydrogenase E1 component
MRTSIAVQHSWESIPLGKAVSRREGNDITLVSVAVGVHRCMRAATVLEGKGIHAGVIDLRTVSPLDRDAMCEAVSRSGRLLVVDEDYRDFGLSGELAATLLEVGIPFRYGRVCTEVTIPYSRELEDGVLPNTKRIVDPAQKLMEQ